MRSYALWLGITGWLATTVSVSVAAPPETGSASGRADELFSAGKFVEAREAYAEAAKADPKAADAILRLGEIALFSNRLGQAEEHLKKARELRPDDAKAKKLLAEVYYRRDDFAKAAPLFRETGRTAIADKLDSFKDRRPYTIPSGVGLTKVPFVRTDPLPVIEVRVNDQDPVLFIIDTGGSEVIIDPELASRVGAARFGAETGTFGGGKKADVEQGSIESLTLAGLRIENLPVGILSTEKFSVAAGGKRIHGILGTVLLYHFISTLDYPKGELVLRPRADTVGENSAAAVEGASTQVIPFWMAGDHYIVAHGTVNQRETGLMFIDTGLAGAGFTCPESTIKAGGISLASEGFEGVGGGGPVKVVPFVVDELALGPVTERNVRGFAGPFPPSLERSFGFRIAGLVSHSFLRPFAVTFDFSKMELQLTKPPTPQP